ncbi:hypothetical protein [Natrinema gari]|nr:hypothetical protein [Natrinema gari]
MSTDPTATAVLEEGEADPDAILTAFDADSPADLVDAGETAVATVTDGKPSAANATDADGTGRADDVFGGVCVDTH